MLRRLAKFLTRNTQESDEENQVLEIASVTHYGSTQPKVSADDEKKQPDQTSEVILAELKAAANESYRRERMANCFGNRKLLHCLGIFGILSGSVGLTSSLVLFCINTERRANALKDSYLNHSCPSDSDTFFSLDPV